MKMRLRILEVMVVLVLSIRPVTDLAAGTKDPEPSCITRILFLGNSYTYFNNLPALVSELAKAGQQCVVETGMVAPGGTRLKDHWESRASHEALNSKPWDFVVLQDQSTLGTNIYFEGNPRIGGDGVFRPYAELWAKEIRQHHATPVFFLTWARAGRHLRIRRR